MSSVVPFGPVLTTIPLFDSNFSHAYNCRTPHLSLDAVPATFSCDPG